LTVKEKRPRAERRGRKVAKKNLSTNRRTTAINASSEASESGNDVELGHNHGSCASFQKICFLQAVESLSRKPDQRQGYFYKTVQKYQPVLIFIVY
jgi:hypothetical protein